MLDFFSRPVRRQPLVGVALLLLAPGWPAPSAAQSAAEESIKREAAAIFQSCYGMAVAHADVLARANAMSSGGREEGLERLVEEVEKVYLVTYQASLGEAQNRISRLETDLRNLPPEKESIVPMDSLTGMCRLASEPVGAAGLDQLRLDIVSYRQGFASLRPGLGLAPGATSLGAAPSAAGQGSAPAKPEVRVRPNDRPLSAAEQQEKREKWQARQQEEELRQQRELQLQQEALDARRNGPAPALPDAKVSVRKELLPPGEPQLTAEQEALRDKMKTWHGIYSDNLRPFKMALSQLMATPANRSYARREACKGVWISVSALNKTDVLKTSPDPAVAAPAVAMGQKFQAAADACLTGNAKEMETLMKEAEQELGKMAAALTPYRLAP